MEYILTKEEIQRLDHISINDIGIPSMVLMERAAVGVANYLLLYREELELARDCKVLILVGTGNNGGDGCAVGRILHEAGCQVELCCIGDEQQGSLEYRSQYEICKKLNIHIWQAKKDLEQEEVLEEKLNQGYDIIVDALWGTGLSRTIEGVYKNLITKVNTLGGLKCAIDIPSGLDATTGEILGIAFSADLTVTFGAAKTGQLIQHGPEYCGDLIVVDIGFPQMCLEEINPQIFSYHLEDLPRLLPKRRVNGNKGSFGKVGIIAGSKEIYGAAYLSGCAAYRSGCGLVQVLTAKENRDSMQCMLPEALLSCYDSKEEAIAQVEALLAWGDVFVIGPGIGTGETGEALVKACLETNKPMIVDADAITILGKHREWIKQRQEQRGDKEIQFVFTPHMKEMERFTHIPMKELKEKPWEHAAMLAKEGIICVLKDAKTVVAAPATERIYMNCSGNDGMAVGGSGDVLTGVIAALYAQGMELEEAARLGVYLHGMAGDMACQERNPYSMKAGDLLEALSQVFTEITKECSICEP